MSAFRGIADILRARRNVSLAVDTTSLPSMIPVGVGGFHDASHTIASQNLAYSTPGGTAVFYNGLSSMTQYMRLCAPGAVTSSGGVRYKNREGSCCNAVGFPFAIKLD
jgi:hypothetical protein